MNSKTFDNVQMNQNERRYFNRRNDFLKNLEQTEEISVTDQRKFDSFFTVKKDIKKLQERSASAKTGAGGRTTPTPQTNTTGMGPEGMETLRDEARKRAVTPQRMPKQMDAPPVVDQPPTLFPIGTRTDFWEENPAVEYDLTGKPKNYSFAQIESFPTSILAISQMSEDFGPFGLPQAQLDKIKFVTSISGFDHSVLKKNYFYLDETIDVEFYRDLSPYSRKVFKNSRYDAESLEMIQPKTIDKVIRQDTIDNPVCLLIVQNCLSEPILDGLFANKKKFMEFASAYEMRIRKNDLDGTTTLVVKPKGVSSFSKIIQEVKSTQTMMDMKLVRDERNISNISNILNSILKLKNIKKPLMRLPAGSEVARNLKSETVSKIFEQLHTLSSYILGRDNGSLDVNLKEIIKRMREFQHQFCEGVPKVRLMKLLFAEVAELKAEEEKADT